MTTKNELQPGPFKDTTTKHIKISPIEITITQARDSSHVPAPEGGCGCGGGGGLPIAVIIDTIARSLSPESAGAIDEAITKIMGGTVPPAPKFEGEGNPKG